METSITASPHAHDPVAHAQLSQEERDKLYCRRVNEVIQPYTVIDVMKKVYHRSFATDLASYIGDHPEEFDRFSDKDASWGMSRLWVNECKIIGTESIFDQPKYACYVDIVISAIVKVEQEKKGLARLRSYYKIKGEFRLRYLFNFLPCHLTCVFDSVVIDKKDSLLELYPSEIRMDKYLLPLLLTTEDYKKAAAYVIDFVKEQAGTLYDPQAPFDPRLWISLMGPKIKTGVFPENGAMGEYFFDFGQADLVDIDTGEVTPDSHINPGTIVLNRAALSSKAIENSTICHEGCHHRFDFFFLMLQKTHGHSFASYLCKRFRKDQEATSQWSPFDIMELHANKLPGYIMMQDIELKAYADQLMESYGGEHTIQNLRRLIEDVAAHFIVPFTMAKRRLAEVGYPDVNGIRQFMDDKRVPDHISNLPPRQTYTIDENDGIREYIRNPEFRRAIDTGLFVYAENHYCLNTSEYVYIDHAGFYHLTDEARKNMAVCCLVFEEKYQHKLKMFFNGRLFKNLGKGSKTIHYRAADGGAATTAEGMALRKRMQKERAQMNVVKKSFNQMTKDLMKSKGYTTRSLSIETGISEDTIKNMRTDPNRVFDMRELVAFCIALHLPYEISMEYIDASLTKFRDTDDMWLYKYALKQWYMLPLDVVNRKLVEAGAVPLTNFVEGFSEEGIRLQA